MSIPEIKTITIQTISHNEIAMVFKFKDHIDALSFDLMLDEYLISIKNIANGNICIEISSPLIGRLSYDMSPIKNIELSNCICCAFPSDDLALIYTNPRLLNLRILPA